MDNHITAVFVGILVAALTLTLTIGHKQPVSICYAYIKDSNGNTHVMQGVQSNDN